MLPSTQKQINAWVKNFNDDVTSGQRKKDKKLKTFQN